MHNNIKRWQSQVLQTIVNVDSVKEIDGHIKAIVTTSQFGVLKTKPYKYTLKEWAVIMERGYIDE